MAQSEAWRKANREIRFLVGQGTLTDEDRKAVVKRVTGKETMKDLSDREMAKVLGEVRRVAPQSKSSKSHVRKIFALWKSAGDVGAVSNKSRTALLAWAARMTKSAARPNGIEDLRQLEWLTYAEARPLIEGLKAMVSRTRETRQEGRIDG